MKRCVFVALVSVALFVTNSNADIKNWQTGQTLPGSEGITPGPGIDLRNWNLSSKNLKYANLAGMDLRNSIFLNSWLDNASFSGSHLANANFYVARL